MCNGVWSIQNLGWKRGMCYSYSPSEPVPESYQFELCCVKNNVLKDVGHLLSVRRGRRLYGYADSRQPTTPRLGLIMPKASFRTLVRKRGNDPSETSSRLVEERVCTSGLPGPCLDEIYYWVGGVVWLEREKSLASVLTRE